MRRRAQSSVGTPTRGDAHCTGLGSELRCLPSKLNQHITFKCMPMHEGDRYSFLKCHRLRKPARTDIFRNPKFVESAPKVLGVEPCSGQPTPNTFMSAIFCVAMRAASPMRQRPQARLRIEEAFDPM